MTVTTPRSEKKQQLVSFGSVESAGVNAFADFLPSELNECQVSTEIKYEDFINTFICHMIFYAIYCLSLGLHIFIDLGLGSFIKNKFLQLIGTRGKTHIEKAPAFA